MNFWPAEFLTTTRTFLAEAIAEINRDKGRPKAIASENFNADLLTMWANEFILLGSALCAHTSPPTANSNIWQLFSPFRIIPSATFLRREGPGVMSDYDVTTMRIASWSVFFRCLTYALFVGWGVYGVYLYIMGDLWSVTLLMVFVAFAVSFIVYRTLEIISDKRIADRG